MSDNDIQLYLQILVGILKNFVLQFISRNFINNSREIIPDDICISKAINYISTLIISNYSYHCQEMDPILL